MKRLLKPLLSIGVISTILAPMSCSTTWRHWDVSNDDTIYETTFPKPDSAPNNLWKIREDAIVMEAWDEASTTLDISLLNNHYELHYVLYSLFKMKTTDLTGDGNRDSIDEYWRSGSLETGGYYKYMKQYLEAMTRTLNITIKYGDSNIAPVIINWDVTTYVNEALLGISTFTGLNSQKAIDIEGPGINAQGIPSNLGQVTDIATAFMANGLVVALLSVNETFALQMSKLANLPKRTFDSFEGFMSHINVHLTKIWNSALYKQFAIEKAIDYSLSEINGLPVYPVSNDMRKRDHFKGLFITAAIGSGINQ